ncbi:MAG: YetF domain-containing protein, partial [Pseudoxanthomonas sp.]
TLIGLNYLVGFITSRSAAADRLIEGVPVVLARDGKLFDRVLKRQLVSTADFEEAMRQAGCIERDQVKLALLETNGQITIIQHAKKD